MSRSCVELSCREKMLYFMRGSCSVEILRRVVVSRKDVVFMRGSCSVEILRRVVVSRKDVVFYAWKLQCRDLASSCRVAKRCCILCVEVAVSTSCVELSYREKMLYFMREICSVEILRRVVVSRKDVVFYAWKLQCRDLASSCRVAKRCCILCVEVAVSTSCVELSCREKMLYFMRGICSVEILRRVVVSRKDVVFYAWKLQCRDLASSCRVAKRCCILCVEVAVSTSCVELSYREKMLYFMRGICSVEILRRVVVSRKDVVFYAWKLQCRDLASSCRVAKRCCILCVEVAVSTSCVELSCREKMLYFMRGICSVEILRRVVVSRKDVVFYAWKLQCRHLASSCRVAKRCCILCVEVAASTSCVELSCREKMMYFMRGICSVEILRRVVVSRKDVVFYAWKLQCRHLASSCRVAKRCCAMQDG